VGGVPEALADGETGHLVPPGDVEAMARRLAELAADEAARRRLGERGRERVREFAPGPMTDRYVELYHEITKT
jgi:glycosyltransferase involved in cell wall biosynthesis